MQRRRKDRWPFLKSLKIYQFLPSGEKQSLSARALDVSDSGMRLIVYQDVPEGESLFIVADQLEALGKIVWKKKRQIIFWTCYEVGVVFQKIRPMKKHLLIHETV